MAELTVNAYASYHDNVATPFLMQTFMAVHLSAPTAKVSLARHTSPFATSNSGKDKLLVSWQPLLTSSLLMGGWMEM